MMGWPLADRTQTARRYLLPRQSRALAPPRLPPDATEWRPNARFRSPAPTKGSPRRSLHSLLALHPPAEVALPSLRSLRSRRHQGRFPISPRSRHPARPHPVADVTIHETEPNQPPETRILTGISPRGRRAAALLRIAGSGEARRGTTEGSKHRVRARLYTASVRFELSSSAVTVEVPTNSRTPPSSDSQILKTVGQT